jgi:regulator of protease activity HflC (stomatin/prohibitin superfamily)
MVLEPKLYSAWFSASGWPRAWVVGAVLLFFLAFSTVYTIESGTVGVLSTFGRYDPQEKQPGLHLKLPLVQSVHVFDVRMHTVNYKSAKEEGPQSGVINKPAIEVLDNKNLPISVELTVQYTPYQDQAAEILTRYGINYFEKLINPIVRDVVRDVVGKYQAEKIAADRTAIANEIRAALGEKFRDLPFQFHDVAMRNIVLPPIVLKKIEEVQLAKQEEQRLEMVEKQAEKNQKIKTIEANTKLIEVTTQAKAEAERARIEADAKAYQILKEAEAIASANQLIANSLTDKLIQYKSVEKWNGTYPATLMQGEGKGVLLQLPQVR